MDPSLSTIADKVEQGIRLTADDGMTLFTSPDLWSVCSLADRVRRRLHGNQAYYNVNRHVNYTNVCALSCSFCAFYRKSDDDGAYEFSVRQVADQAAEAQAAGATEIHIVGGLHPYLPFAYYLDMLRAIREAAPRLHIKAFTAVEIVHLARIDKRPKELEQILSDLKDAGLGSLPGGGAEVFDDRVHDEAFKGKIRSDKWLDVHRAAHRIGLNTNATILYGHIESLEDRIHHMELLRQAQDEALHDWAQSLQGVSQSQEYQDHGRVVLTGPDAMYGINGNGAGNRLPQPSDTSGYFQTIIPLPFIPDDSALQHLPGPAGLDNLRMIAVSRLMLDNLPHVKAFWIMQTLPLAQIMLQSGADDMDGTVVWYDITKVGGTDTHQEVDVTKLRRTIVEAGCVPVERDTLYRPITRNGPDWHVAAQPDPTHAPEAPGSIAS
ncbi:MAG: radical SAM protein [Planctomycetes bacterium]|nr:radical SAM protein [Planctomycetota bacterium]NOG55319.1 radical SAM protein [Planctomycetota bacterium]